MTRITMPTDQHNYVGMLILSDTDIILSRVFDYALNYNNYTVYVPSRNI